MVESREQEGGWGEAEWNFGLLNAVLSSSVLSNFGAGFCFLLKLYLARRRRMSKFDDWVDDNHCADCSGRCCAPFTIGLAVLAD